MRYRGQSYEVSVSVSKFETDEDIAALAKRFHEAHRRRYGHMAASEAVEIVNFHVTAVGQIPKPQFHEIAKPAGSGSLLPHERRTAYFNSTDAIEVPVFRRSSTCRRAAAIDGPAVVEEKTSTVVVYPGERAVVDGYLNIEICQGP